ncbi:MAG: hypothetical protein P1U54_10060 [Immundisolibacteraceae bacterium]|nr:hypothetical protein [Immundisolibacteraceae bacterium]
MNGNNPLPRGSRCPAARRAIRYLALTTLLTCGIAIGQPAYVIDSLWIGVNSEPDGTGTTLQIIHTGAEIDVETINDGQAKIETAEGVVGWVDASYLAKDPPLAEQFRTITVELDEKDKALSRALNRLDQLESSLQPDLDRQTPAKKWLRWTGLGLGAAAVGFFAGIAWRNRGLRKKFGGLLP